MRGSLTGTVTAAATYQEAVLGFDARETFVDPVGVWTPERRRTYLLRGHVEKPLSVDPLVWPSVFGDGFLPEQRARYAVGDLPLPAWRGANAPLWEDLDAMRAVLAPVRLAHRIVAVSWVSDDGFAAARPGRAPYREPTVPASLGSDWGLLGYDVADEGCISGLSNCGYERGERARLGAGWASRLNDDHLFACAEDALAFRTLTDARVPEHAPFFVMALRVLRPPTSSSPAR